MNRLTINTEEIIGKVKPMHGVGSAPFYGVNDSMFHYLAEAGILYSRLHDVGDAFGGYVFVDIPNIFRDFNADADDERSYDFVFTDWLLTNLIKQNTMPIFRLGVTIENWQKIKAYRIYPPEDFGKWAKICAHIIMHYNYGWANGYNMNITYWEIWNEPENAHPDGDNQMWKGTKEEYFELYDTAAKYLKSCFPSLKFGGYAGCGFYGLEEYKYNGDELLTNRYRMEFFKDFLSFVKKNNSPIDFFSWHSYESVNITVKFARYVKQSLCEYGLNDVESILDEWNTNSPWNTEHEMIDRASAKAAADVCEMMCRMQAEAVDICCYYDASWGVSNWGGMFHPYTGKPLKTYYSFKAFNELYMLKQSVKCNMECDGSLFAVSAVDGNICRAVITNTSQRNEMLEINMDTAYKFSKIIITDSNKTFEEDNSLVNGKLYDIPKESVITLEWVK